MLTVMKKVSIIILLMFLFNLVSQAQKDYSQENLNKLSQEELDAYLDKALKLQKTGRTFNIIGGASLGTAVGLGLIGAISDSESWTLVGIVGVGVLAGGTSLAIGVPLNLTGKKRVERINFLKATTLNNLSIDLKPCTQYNLMTQKYHPGVSIRISF